MIHEQLWDSSVFFQLWNHSNNYLVTTLDDFDLFDLPILDDLDDFFEDFDYRSLFFFDLGMTGTLYIFL